MTGGRCRQDRCDATTVGWPRPAAEPGARRLPADIGTRRVEAQFLSQRIRPPDPRHGPAGKSESSCSSRSCRAARSRVLRTRRAGPRLGVNRRGTRNRGVEERTLSVTQQVRKCPTASRASSRSVVKRVTVDIAASPTVARQPSFRRREMLVGPGIIRVRACRHERTGGRRWPRRAGARRPHDAAAAVYDQPIGIRLLFGDPNSGKEHYLIRYAPGVRSRAHRHTGTPWSSSRGRSTSAIGSSARVVRPLPRADANAPSGHHCRSVPIRAHLPRAVLTSRSSTEAPTGPLSACSSSDWAHSPKLRATAHLDGCNASRVSLLAQ
jgi:hypothetical protein